MFPAFDSTLLRQGREFRPNDLVLLPLVVPRYRDSHMAQGWLASVLLYAEKSLRTFKGHEYLPLLAANIAAEQATPSAT